MLQVVVKAEGKVHVSRRADINKGNLLMSALVNLSGNLGIPFASLDE